ncbi:NUDIX domain-containing protein [Isoptericola jiangsuensis]|uniref:NUDIX domain-containing protein n=1 Tax=Isoptericola jiangsuensis TaxID=548579 RepID=UPI003AAAC9F6
MRTSAGLLLYRVRPDGLDVLLGHMGGPYWARKDERAWTIFKGEVDDGEEPHAAAEREAAEELGLELPPSGRDVDLGEVRQKAGKRVLAWAREWPDPGPDLSRVRSNTVEIRWPPRSGRVLEVPEIDRVAWFAPDDARRMVVAAQAALVDRLGEALAR